MIKTELKKLISKGKTQSVIQQLLEITEDDFYKEYRDKIIMLSARFERHEEAKLMGVSSKEEDGIASSTINKALLNVIDQLPDQQASAAKTKPDTSNEKNTSVKNNLWKYITGFAVIVGMLTGLADLMNIINIIPSKADSSASQLTIYVHGPKGVQDYVLENTGELLVDFDGDRRYAKIGEKGRTVFNEIPSKFIGQSLPISVAAKGYEPAQSNQRYDWNGKAIYFPVQQEQQLGLIKGIVKSEDGAEFLSNVLITIENEFSIKTDSLGKFFYEMKNDNIKDQYSLSLQKKGYKNITEYYYPPSSVEFRLKKK